MPDAERKEYRGRDVTVSFDASRCLHAAECVRGLPEVFDTSQRPWIQPDASDDAARVAEVVRRCPSGALRYQLASGAPEQPDSPTVFTAREGGGIVVRGDLRIATPDGELAELRAVLCDCGRTARGPFCDNSCRKADAT